MSYNEMERRDEIDMKMETDREEHTSELQSPLRISYAVFCLKKIFFNDTATTEIYTLSLHDALPIFSPTPSSTTTAAHVLQRDGAT